MRRLLHALLRQLAGQHGAAGSVVCASGGASVGCEVGHQRENTGTRTAALLQKSPYSQILGWATAHPVTRLAPPMVCASV
jgi:hypothetical protein